MNKTHYLKQSITGAIYNTLSGKNELCTIPMLAVITRSEGKQLSQLIPNFDNDRYNLYYFHNS